MTRPWEQIALFDLHEPAPPAPAPEPGDDATEIAPEETAPAEPASAEPTTTAAAANLLNASATEPAATPPAPVWEALPAGEEADGHALIVTADGTYTPSGRELTGSVDSVEKLDKLIR